MSNLEVPVALDAGSVRNVWTSAFVILNFAISFLGSRLLRRRVQHHLILQKKDPEKRNFPVPINHLTPWLAIGDFSTYVWHIRKIPGGRYGVLMLGTAVFSLAHQYFVNSFIVPAWFPTRCQYSTGINTLAGNVSVTPASQWFGESLVYSAFWYADANGGERGIYEKVPYLTSYQNFKPTPEDVLGSWDCVQKPGIVMYPLNWTSQEAAMDYIDQQDFLYTDASSYAGAEVAGSHIPQGFVYWSTNAPDNLTGQWDLRATIIDNLQYTPVNTPATTSNFQCSISISTTRKWTPPPMPAGTTLTEWDAYMYGAIRSLSDSYYQSTLERVLNTMSILAGSTNAWSFKPLPGQSTDYGCNIDGSITYSEIYIMFIVLVFILFMVIVVDLYAFARYKLGHMGEIGDELSFVPIDLLSWQLALIRHSTGNDGLKKKDMRNVSYAYLANDQDMHQELKFFEQIVPGKYSPLPVSSSDTTPKSQMVVTVNEKTSSSS